MTRLLPMAAVLTVLGGSGCLHVQPIGPLAGPPGSAAADPGAKTKAAAAKDVAAAPVVQPAPPPPLPAVYVTPGEVTEANYEDKVRRLAEELDADGKSADAMRIPGEVSVIKK